MLWLVTKRKTYLTNIEALKMFSHYKRVLDVIGSDTNYLDYVMLIDDNGEIVKEYYRDEE